MTETQGVKMMRRRQMLCAGAGLGLSGCGLSRIARGGETVSYALFNATRDQALEVSMMHRVGAKNELITAGPFRMYIPPPNAIGWQGGGALYMADTGHRVPERVLVSWRLPPKEGQEELKGDLMGPYEIELRSRIPKEVLEAVGISAQRMRLEIAVSVGVLPIQVRWQLTDFNRPHRQQTVYRGGDW